MTRRSRFRVRVALVAAAVVLFAVSAVDAAVAFVRDPSLYDGLSVPVFVLLVAAAVRYLVELWRDIDEVSL